MLILGKTDEKSDKDFGEHECRKISNKSPMVRRITKKGMETKWQSGSAYTISKKLGNSDTMNKYGYIGEAKKNIQYQDEGT